MLRVETLEHRVVPADGQFLVESFSDLNESGLWDSAEPGVAGVAITYAGQGPGNSGVSGDMSTASTGIASATLASGMYFYNLAVPSGYTIMVPVALFGNISITEGQTFSLQLPMLEDEPSAFVGDRIWLDADADGLQNSAENGLAGVNVLLLDTDGSELQSTLSGTDG